MFKILEYVSGYTWSAKIKMIKNQKLETKNKNWKHHIENNIF
jgi:hypothetical protein